MSSPSVADEQPQSSEVAVPVPAAAATATPSTSSFPYRITIVAPDALRDVLTRSVGLVRWQDYADMTPELFDQLARDAIGEARDAAATEGYFSAAIDITVDRTPHPAAVTLQVVEGEPTRIASVDIGLDGPATENAAGIEAIAEIRRQWLLPQGAIFRQRLWDSAKERAVATLAASPFASAHLASSEAAIDPDARRADLKVAIDSGPPFFFGGLAITGLSNYDLSLVRNFSTLTRGEPYSLRSVQEYVRRLTNTGYFASVQAAIDPDPATAAEATVKVGVIEAPPKRIEAGIGYSTDTQFRANLTYRDVNIDGHALRFSAEARYESLAQVGSLRFDWPPDDTRWANAVLAQVERTDLNDLITKTATIGFRRTSIEERNQWQFGIGGIYDQQFPLGASEVISHALYIDAQRAWRRTDDLLSPTRGWMAVLAVGAGIPGVSSLGFGRVVGHVQGWLPLGDSNELTARAEGGAVIASTRIGVPSTLLFRTGGETSVRGYKFDSLGVQDGQATVPGRYYAVGSVEVTHWINDFWGLATFIDAGNAVDSLADFRFALGYGVGARVRTPIGPFRIDIAYGQDARQVRVQFSIGISF